MPQRTPLYNEHLKLKARMVDFAGWEMPVQYSGVIDEHRAVRKAAGLFDVSHMGEVEVTGTDAAAFVQYLTANDVSKLVDGKAHYSLLCNEKGGVVDDIIVYRESSQRFFIVVNASNREKDFSWITKHKRGNVSLRDASDAWGLIALQGPKSAEILKKICAVDLKEMKSFRFQKAIIAEHECIVARTGYTGELGCEIFTPSNATPLIWRSLLEAGTPQGLKPCGLGARDTLRLEMAYSLYGHELTDEINPLEAGLSWVVKLDIEEDFIGKEALQKIQAAGLTRKITGLRMIESGIPRQNYFIVVDGKKVGYVTSGTMSPTLEQPIGLGLVPIALAQPGSQFSIDIRGRARKAEAVPVPFYQPSSKE